GEPACPNDWSGSTALGHRLIRAHPNSGGRELDEGEVVGVMLFEPRCDGAEMLEFAEEALDQIAIAVEEGAEGRDPHATSHGLDVGPCTVAGDVLAEGVAVVGAIGQEDLARPEARQHVLGALAVMGLTLAELERNGQAVGIDESMDLGGQAAPRAPHASGSKLVPSGSLRPPFLTLAAC